MKNNKKAFTLIELVAVLVILAILALIVTPIVMSVINKAKTSANKRSIDAYGRSIELAIASHMLDTGEIPTSIDELTIEYSGDEVVCETQELKSDSTVYLANCTVGGKAVEGYTYGKGEEGSTNKSYSVGDEVTYNNVDYYVIKNSSASEDSVTLLKKTPLTVNEVNEYGGVGTANNHVNVYACQSSDSSCYQTAADVNNSGYGGMQYYSSEICELDNYSEDCITDYEGSEVKFVVDAWKIDQASAATSARLITLDDLTDNLGMELNKTDPTTYQITVTEDTPTWVMGENYIYWTMTTNNDKNDDVWLVNNSLSIGTFSVKVSDVFGAVRPVITISKSTLQN